MEFGFRYMMGMEENIYFKLIRLFFVNINCNRFHNENKSNVLEKNIILNEKSLSNILHLKDEGSDVYEGKSIPKVDDFDHMDVLRRILYNNTLKV